MPNQPCLNQPWKAHWPPSNTDEATVVTKAGERLEIDGTQITNLAQPWKEHWPPTNNKAAGETCVIPKAGERLEIDGTRITNFAQPATGEENDVAAANNTEEKKEEAK